jgi:hypothetical protein
MGRLFDESDEPLYSCWAKKGAHRYRYFVSRKLIRGSNKPEERGWRLPAGRTEEAVTAAAILRQVVSKQSEAILPRAISFLRAVAFFLIPRGTANPTLFSRHRNSRLPTEIVPN